MTPASTTFRALTASIQLSAIARTASGGVDDQAAVTWSSSDPGVVIVTSAGVATAVSEGAVVISASAGGVVGTAAVAVSQEVVGISVSPDPLFMDAVGEEHQLDAAAVDSLGQVVPGWDFAWETSDSSVVTVTDGLASARGLGNAIVSASSGARVGVTRVFVQERVSSVALSIGTATLESLGETTTLLATALSGQGVAIDGVGFEYSSSAPSVASISNQGEVTAHANGTAILTAKTLGAEASVTIEVIQTLAQLIVGPAHSLLASVGTSAQLEVRGADARGHEMPVPAITYRTTNQQVVAILGSGRMVATGYGFAAVEAVSGDLVGSAAVSVGDTSDWSRTTDWQTFQGNAGHTGHVPVVLDPRNFSEAWSTVVAPGINLNPVTASEGTIAVSTLAYFGTQELHAVDESTGAVRWTHDFGRIHGVHPPASGNGRIFVTTSGHDDSFLWSFDPLTGAVRFQSEYDNQWARSYAPVVVGSDVFMNGGTYGGVYSFDANTGGQQWFRPLSQYDQWTPAVRVGLLYAYTGLHQPEVTVFEAGSGRLSFQLPDPGFRFDGWSMNTVPVVGGPLNVIAVQGGRLLSFNLVTKAVGWERASSYDGTPALAAGVIYVYNNDQLEARSERDGSLLWEWAPPTGSLRVAPVVSDNLVFMSTESTVYAVHLGSHQTLWSFGAGGHLAVTPSGYLLIAQNGGELTAVRLR